MTAPEERKELISLISEATTLYNAEKYQDALGQYRTALQTPQGEQLRVQSGIYLSNMKLGPTVPRGLQPEVVDALRVQQPGGRSRRP